MELCIFSQEVKQISRLQAVRNKPRARGQIARIIPHALFDQATNLVDHLVVMNWWLNQSPKEMAVQPLLEGSCHLLISQS